MIKYHSVAVASQDLFTTIFAILLLANLDQAWTLHMMTRI